MRAKASPVFSTDTSISFFTNVASRLLSSELNLNLNQIQVYPTNQYTPSVHRLLQVTANIYDATTTNFYPSVFRPVFSTDTSGTNVFITGYRAVESVTGIIDSQLEQPVDVSALASSGVLLTNAAVNVYGVPWIIGAKKNLPGLNQFSLVNAVQFTRKLQVVRQYVGGPISTNQLVVMSFTNYLGVSFWNSYTNDYPTNNGSALNLTIVVNQAVRLVVTNSDWGSTTASYLFTTNYLFTPSRWPGSKWGSKGSGTPAVNSFITTNWINGVIPQAAYNFTTKTFDLLSLTPNPWDTNRTTMDPLPQFGVLTTNWVQAFIVDDTHVVDYVQLRGPIDGDNVNSALNDPNYADATGTYYLWSTNIAGAGTMPSWGIVNQMDISSKPIAPPPSAQWSNPGVTILGVGNFVTASRILFASFLSPTSTYQYTTDSGQVAVYTNNYLSVESPYRAVRTIFVPYLYQVNDPLVHYMANDLDVGNAAVWAGNNLHQNGVWIMSDNLGAAPIPTPPTSEIVKGRYQPWGKAAPTWFQAGGINGYNFQNPYNLIYKDSLVWSSDYWNFPTGQALNLNWLGRVHRGTPWQTIYLKANNVLHASSGSSGTNTWKAWTGNYYTEDALLTAPVTDRQLVSLLVGMLNTNDLRTELSVNNADPNAWAARLDGFTVFTNSVSNLRIQTLPPQFDPIIVSSNSAQAILIANAIQTNRTFRQSGSYDEIADILSTIALTEQSPYLNLTGAQITNGITDEAYEIIPSQLLPLLRTDSFGMMTSTNGQLQVQFSGYDGHAYVVQISPDLINWTSISTNSPVGGVFNFNILPTGNSTRQFYRSLLLQ